MSESQQVTTQPEEVKEPQPAGDVQAEAASDKAVESTEKPVEESKNADQQQAVSEPQAESEPQKEQEATEQEQPAVSEPTEVKAVPEEKVSESDTKALDGKEEAEVEQAVEAKEDAPVEAPVEEKETPAAAEPKVLESNGEAVEQTEQQQQPQQQQQLQAEETNGVSKRKAENGADAVEEEKSPKKAKVVDEGDQSAQAVEERAA